VEHGTYLWPASQLVQQEQDVSSQPATGLLGRRSFLKGQSIAAHKGKKK
jgi:hypothetical protein